MSADNWSQCPNCLNMARVEKSSLHDLVVGNYGKMPISEWLDLKKEADRPISLKDTLREYYGIGITEDGEFYVHYSGVCQECGFEHRFKHDAPVELVGSIPPKGDFY